MKLFTLSRGGGQPPEAARVSPTFRAVLVQDGRNPSLGSLTPRSRRRARVEHQPNSHEEEAR